MAVIRDGAKFLLAARALGADFSCTLTLGRQELFMLTPKVLASVFEEMNDPLAPAEAEAMFTSTPAYAEPFFHRLGAVGVDSLDSSAYEGATILHDLSEPPPPDLRGRFSVIYDGGTLEHIFEFPDALRNCMAMVAPGGHLLITASANNFFGHGFYQPSPEVFFGAFSEANGFRVERMFVRAFGTGVRRWYAVSDPAQLGRRLELRNGRWTFLHVIGRRTADRDPRTETPTQSTFEQLWRAEEPSQARSILGRVPIVSRIRARYPLIFDREAYTPVSLEDMTSRH